MKTRLLAVLAVVVVIGLGAFALAWAHGEREAPAGHPHGPGEEMDRMMGGGHGADRPWISLALQNRDQLGLSPDQVKALKSLRTEFGKEATRRSADLEVAEIELAELLRADPVDLAKVETKLRQIEALRTEIRLSRIRVLEKGKSLLSPDQRKKLEGLGLRASGDAPGGMMTGRGMEEMQRFMNSERMPQAMAAMRGMAQQMGDGDTMAGMVRMMEMMSMMGQMMGGQGGMGMMGPGRSQPTR